MISKLSKIAAISLLLLSTSVFSSITKLESEKIIKRIHDIYGPVVQKIYRRSLVFELLWEDDGINAFAGIERRNRVVRVLGGESRHQMMTKDIYTLVLCHEVGHHIGGLPKTYRIDEGISKTTAEGVADYFAASKCMKKVIQFEKNSEIVKGLNVDPFVKKECEQVWQNKNDIAICERIATTGLLKTRFHEALKNSNDISHFETPDENVVSETITMGYPSKQCRLDTYLAGALCNKNADLLPSRHSEARPEIIAMGIGRPLTLSDVNEGYCGRNEGYRIGARPLCWFNPEKYSSVPSPEFLDAYFEGLGF